MDSTLPVSVYVITCAEIRPVHSAEYLLLLPLGGSLMLGGPDGQEIPSGELLFYSPFEKTKLFLQAGSNVIFVSFLSNFFEDTLGIPKSFVPILGNNKGRLLIEKLVVLFDLYHNQKDVTKLNKMAAVYDLLQTLEPLVTVSDNTEPEVNKLKPRKSQMVRYLENHFRLPIQLADFASAFGVSRQHISTVFHKETGVSFSKYLSQLRLNEAERLLITTDKTMNEVSEDSGFPNIKSFYSAFNAAHSCTPGEYRGKNTRTSDQMGPPTREVLQNINQFLSNYRSVYTKSDAVIFLNHTVPVTTSTPLSCGWADILNIDFAADCLNSKHQRTISEIQRQFHFKYARICNIFDNALFLSLPLSTHFRFIGFTEVIEFLRKQGLTPMLSFGSNYSLAEASLVCRPNVYADCEEHWYQILTELLEVSIRHWGTEWMSTWRFEFFMPDSLYEGHGNFMELFEKSARIIKKLLPDVAIGGPAMSISNDNISRWHTWISGVKERNIPVDFVSFELWADVNISSATAADQNGDLLTLHSLVGLNNADTSLAIDKVILVKELLKKHGIGDKQLYISAFGIAKYHPQTTQLGGHNSAYLVKCILAMLPMVDGIGCWKALINDGEYHDEIVLFSMGCGLVSRFGLYSTSWYAYQFISALLPYVLYQNRNIYVTTDHNDNYAVLINNCKDYSPYYYKHFTDGFRYHLDDPKFYADNDALTLTLTLDGVTPNTYRINQQLIGDRYGCVVNTIDRMGAFDPLQRDLVSYIRGQSQPYQYSYILETTGTLPMTVTLQPNEVMLLRISPKQL